MKTLSRRTALAAVPALAAATTMAGTARASASPTTNPDPLALSPHFVEPFAKWRACDEAGDFANAEARRIEEAGIAREGIEPAPLSGFEDMPKVRVYWAKLDALPEHAEIERLRKVASEQWGLSWQYADELRELQPETLGDIVAQLKSFIGSKTPEDIEDKILLDLAGNIRRIGGAS